jgi:hypothetical protein
MINVYINIAITGNVNSVLLNLIDRINKSGLYDNCNKIYLVFNGKKELINIDIKGDKYVHINENYDISKCEFPTLELIWNHCQNDNIKVIYLHTKGVSKPNNQCVIDQTNYLSHFNINKWIDRVNELEECDCTGVNFRGNFDDIYEHPSTWGYGKAPLHYSGNFWWSKSSHIRKLPNPFNWLPDNNYFRWRMMAEMWLCQISSDVKYYNVHSSNVDHYISPYPEEKYINE